MTAVADLDPSRLDWLAEEFERHRSHLRAVGYRMLGSLTEADDAIQEAWIRLQRRDPGGTDDLRGWLTVTFSRICLDCSPVFMGTKPFLQIGVVCWLTWYPFGRSG